MAIKVNLDAKATDVVREIVGGGSGGIDIAPLVVFKAGEKFKVDFSKGSYLITYDLTDATSIIYEYVATGGSSANIQILIQANEGKTQLVASLADSYSYQSLSNEVVIYEGDLTEEPSSTSSIDYA